MNAELKAKPKPRYTPVVQYFADIWDGISTTCVGMRLTLGYLFSKNVTLRYPEARPVMPATSRGFHTYEEGKCSLCQRCVTSCPVDCITFEAVGRGKDRLLTQFSIDYSRCIFCNLCAEVCPEGGLVLTEAYDMARGTRAECQLEFARPKTQAEIDEVNERVAKKAAEKAAKAAEKERAAKEAAAKEAQEGESAE